MDSRIGEAVTALVKFALLIGLIGILSLVATLLWWLFASPAHADSFDETAVILAQSYVAESGWDSPVDQAAMYHALEEGAFRRGVSIADQARSYVAVFRTTHERSQWVTGLNAEATEPPGWPADVSWERYGRPRWLRLLAHAKTDLVFPPPNPCNGKPRHWGGPSLAQDATRAARALHDGRWRALQCGPVRNGYYATR